MDQVWTLAGKKDIYYPIEAETSEVKRSFKEVLLQEPVRQTLFRVVDSQGIITKLVSAVSTKQESSTPTVVVYAWVMKTKMKRDILERNTTCPKKTPTVKQQQHSASFRAQ